MSFYNQKILPRLVDKICSASSAMKQRQKVVPMASGRVLEIGVGTGLNLGLYSDAVSHLTGIDPSLAMVEKTRTVASKLGQSANISEMDACALDFEAGCFDTVVMTYTLCSVGEPRIALSEIRRVLAADGKLITVEHGVAPDKTVSRFQHALNPVWGLFSGGCNINRNVANLLDDTGFSDDYISSYIPGPKFLSYETWGVLAKR